MCRYREYTFACGHKQTETPPYLPCNPDDFCVPGRSDDPPIKIKKSVPCGNETCEASDGMQHQHTDGGTSWARTNSGQQGRALGENPGDRLRHTVSTKLKAVNLVRSLTKKHKEGNQKQQNNNNGADGFLPENQNQSRNGNHRVYEEIGNEMDELKK